MQQVGFIYFAGIYPKVVSSGKFGVKIGWVFSLIGLYGIGVGISYFIKPYLWTTIFPEVLPTGLHEVQFIIFSISIPLNCFFLSSLTKLNANGEFVEAIKLNLVGVLTQLVFIGYGLYTNNFIMIASSFLMYEISASLYCVWRGYGDR